ncbi:MAG: polysaccharide lyase family 7 protein [Polyangiaceae bacterium]|nr:polysaccharide lyase family 7 protein [Polyangiaceae bacterium]
MNNQFKWVAAPIATCPAPATTGSSTNTNAPATYFDLSKWKITLPVDKFSESKPTEMYEWELPNWFDSNFFFASNGKMVFKVPNTGVTTSGTSSTRSELRDGKPGAMRRRQHH